MCICNIYIWENYNLATPIGQFRPKNEKASNLINWTDKYSRIDWTIDRTFTMSYDDRLDKYLGSIAR
jgi:hypothetical protein